MSGGEVTLEDKPIAGGDFLLRRQRRRIVLFGGLTGATVLCALLALAVGAYSIPVGDVAHALLHGAARLFDDAAATTQLDLVVLQIRLPRVLFGLIVGAALGGSGAAMQALFRNPLADPGLIGVSAGAALGAVAMIVFGGFLIPAWAVLWSAIATPVAAFLGAATVTFVIMMVGSRGGTVDVSLMLLAGIAINAMAGAGIGAMTYLADDQELRSLTFWTMGSLAVSGWGTLGVTALLILPAVVWLSFQGGALNRYLLGEAEAGHLGVDVRRLKGGVILSVAVAVGGAVSVAGAIGFVGLVVPHLVRMLGGPDNRIVVPGAALLGAALTVLADTFARGIAAPAEVPVGLVLSAVGGPFFLWFLLTQRWRGR